MSGPFALLLVTISMSGCGRFGFEPLPATDQLGPGDASIHPDGEVPPDADGRASATDGAVATDGAPDATFPDASAAPAGIVAWYRFDDSCDEALDSSGSGLHGTCATDQCPVAILGPVGRACRFDGRDDVFRIPHDVRFETPSDLTVAAWIQPNRLRRGGFFVKLIGSAQLNSWKLALTDENTVNFRSTDGSSVDSFDSPSPLIQNVWVHVAATYDGTAQRLYFDGVEVGSMALSTDRGFDSGDVLIGADQNRGVEELYFAGDIDDVRIYDRALGSLEILAVMDEAAR